LKKAIKANFEAPSVIGTLNSKDKETKILMCQQLSKDPVGK
jgi:hypothetical protein